MNKSSENAHLLVSILPSHYCEKVRWALDYSNITYVEDSYPPVFHWLGTRKHGAGKNSVPVLVTKENILKDSTDILKYLDCSLPEQLKLYPTDSNLRLETEKLEDMFDTQLGPASRRWAYFYLFQKPEIIFKEFCNGSKPTEEFMFKTFFPIIAMLMKKKMNVTFKATQRSRQRIKDVFEKVEKQLSDGRKYLTGEQFTAADITFSSLASILVMPDNYFSTKLSDLPEQMQTEIEEYRKTVAGKYAMNLFTEKRK